MKSPGRLESLPIFLALQAADSEVKVSPPPALLRLATQQHFVLPGSSSFRFHFSENRELKEQDVLERREFRGVDRPGVGKRKGKGRDSRARMDAIFAKEIFQRVCAAGGSLKVTEIKVRLDSGRLDSILQDKTKFILSTVLS
ncbi:hypothetical protein L345_01169, partial [Ophiophagus hannah]